LDDILIDVRPSVCGAVISRNISRVITSKSHFSRAVVYPHVWECTAYFTLTACYSKSAVVWFHLLPAVCVSTRCSWTRL